MNVRRAAPIRAVASNLPTIKTVYVGVLTVYALVGAPAVRPLVNLTVVLLLLLMVPLLVVTANRIAAPSDPLDRLLVPTARQRQMVGAELEKARSQGVETWWAEIADRARWFDDYFAYWWKFVGIPAAELELHVSYPELTKDTYDGVPDSVVVQQPHRRKAALVAVTNLLSDSVHYLECAPFAYELARHVSRDQRSFLTANPDVSTFGVRESLPYPGILCSHNVLVTADGWIVFSLRSNRTDFYPNTWSCSFEEQVEIGRGPAGQSQHDLTLGDTVLRGVAEEFGSAARESVKGVHTVAVGSEVVETPTMSVRGGAPVSVVELGVTRSELWALLNRPAQIRDADEAAAWMALRFGRAADVVSLLKRYPPNTLSLGPQALREDARVAVEVHVHPGSTDRLAQRHGHGWHPTARARLLLWSQWAVANNRLAG